LFLSVVFNATVASVFVGVPLGVMQAFSRTNNPMMLYNSMVFPSYHALLLSEKYNCPLLFENGVLIWAD
jgi:hypothetical protein